MSIGASTRLRNARAQATINDIDAGVLNGEMRFYSAPRPVTGGSITTLIAVNKLLKPSGSVLNGVLVFNAVADDLAVKAYADIVWCRIVDGDGVFVMDLDCGLTGSGADIIFDDISGKTGGTVKILSGNITEGNL